MQGRSKKKIVVISIVLTKYSKVSDLLQSPPEVAAWLEAASIGVNIYMADRLLDPDAEP